ncbi:class F sortase [Microbacterium azadirachtae]|uniref:class F sortase n=1 Tax=Microbacterium azadirachtae TaxID=582680 RepID=UPI000AD03DB0|nr:class F sortase [Microbacterium azadirachtae]
MIRVVTAIFLAGVAAAAGTWTITTYLAEQQYPKDMRGNPVVRSPLPSSVDNELDAVSALQGMTLTVPSRGLTVPIGAINAVDGVINPPGFASAYFVRNYGANLTHAHDGTVFVVMHSCRGGAICPGNYLIDDEAGTTSLEKGADVFVGGLHYRVVASKTLHKPDVRAASDIWENTPGRLVLMTCMQVTAGTDGSVSLGWPRRVALIWPNSAVHGVSLSV